MDTQYWLAEARHLVDKRVAQGIFAEWMFKTKKMPYDIEGRFMVSLPSGLLVYDKCAYPGCDKYIYPRWDIWRTLQRIYVVNRCTDFAMLTDNKKYHFPLSRIEYRWRLPFRLQEDLFGEVVKRSNLG